MKSKFFTKEKSIYKIRKIELLKELDLDSELIKDAST